MEQLKMHSVDGVDQNVERIATLFHNDVTLKIECTIILCNFAVYQQII